MVETETRGVGGQADVARVILSSVGGTDVTSLDAAEFGKLLMGTGKGGDDGMLVVYNPLGSVRNEMVTLAVPVCAVNVYDAETGEQLPSQVSETHIVSPPPSPSQNTMYPTS